MQTITTNKIKNDIIAKILFKSLHPKRNGQRSSKFPAKAGQDITSMLYNVGLRPISATNHLTNKH